MNEIAWMLIIFYMFLSPILLYSIYLSVQYTRVKELPPSYNGQFCYNRPLSHYLGSGRHSTGQTGSPVGYNDWACRPLHTIMTYVVGCYRGVFTPYWCFWRLFTWEALGQLTTTGRTVGPTDQHLARSMACPMLGQNIAWSDLDWCVHRDC